MGHIFNPKILRLGRNRNGYHVTTTQPYKDFMIMRFVQNTVKNYGNTDFSRKFLRNNKTNSKINKSGSNNIIINYIYSKLGQYFSINQVLGPILSDFRKTPFLDGFKIMVAGKLTRKESYIMIRKNGKVTLAQNSALIDYSAQGRNLRFGMVGVKVWFMRKSLNYTPYFYRLSIIMLPTLRKIVDKTNNIIYRGQVCHYNNWTVAVRKNDPIGSVSEQKKKMEYSEELQGYLLKDTDFSGANHKLLLRPSTNLDYYEVIGSFTSSSTHYNNSYPHMVSSYNLEDQNKPQFFHKYNDRVCVKKDKVSALEIETKLLNDPEYYKFCEDLDKGVIKNVSKAFFDL